MQREQVTLMMLASAEGASFTPAQIQKAMFLLDRESPRLFARGSKYAFKAYDYGPFDSAVYTDIENWAKQGYAEIIYGRVRAYRATDVGIGQGKVLLGGLEENQRNYVKKVSTFVRSQSFSDLVSSIYRAYPEMKVNSIFVGEK